MTLLAGAEFILALAAVHIAAFVRFTGDLPADTEGIVLWLRSAVFGAVVIIALTAMGLYQSRQRLNVEGVLIRMVLALALAAVGLALIYYVLPQVALWRGWWVLSLVLTLVFLVGSRTVFTRIVAQDFFRRRVVVYGAGKRAATLLELRRRSDQRGFQLLAFFPVPNEVHAIRDERVDCSTSNLVDFVRKYEAEEVVIAMDDRRQNFPIRELLDCKFAGVDVVDVLTFLERESGKVKIDLLDPSWMIFSQGFTQRSSRMVVLRLFDLTVSFIVLALGWPFMLLTALAILLEDGGVECPKQGSLGLGSADGLLLHHRGHPA
jgi:FlaA1/EpsC-like NDP-sugar epimerase